MNLQEIIMDQPVEMAEARQYICWNCGSRNHQIAQCDKEVRQENKTFWRKQFRRNDHKELVRHQGRYKTFLKEKKKLNESGEPVIDDHELEEMIAAKCVNSSMFKECTPEMKEFWMDHFRFRAKQKKWAQNKEENTASLSQAPGGVPDGVPAGSGPERANGDQNVDDSKPNNAAGTVKKLDEGIEDLESDSDDDWDMGGDSDVPDAGPQDQGQCLIM